jgi:glycosyltransferase involved in cell wall biosynthesis
VRIAWSLPVRGEHLTSSRGDVVRARHLIEALRREGHDVIVIDDAAHGHTQAAVTTYRHWLRWWLPRPAAFILRDIGRVVHGCMHGAHVWAAVRATRADLIIETQVAYTLSGPLASRLTGTPLVFDDCSPSSEEHEFGTGLPALAKVVMRLQGRAARSIVAVSPALREMLAAEGIPRHKIWCVPNGIGVEAFTSAALAAQRPAGLDDGCVVGFIGSFQPWHCVELLIDAVASLSAACRIQVVLAGDGPGLSAVLDRAAQRGVQDRVISIGAVSASAVPALLSAWDVGVMPHSNEYGDPMKLREYAAAGIPSIAPDFTPIRDVVEDNVTGLLFRPGDVDALAQALVRLAADRSYRRRLGDEARRRALAGGSWRDRARSLLNVAVSVRGCAASSAPTVTSHGRPRAGAQEF